MTVNLLSRMPSCCGASWTAPGVEAVAATGRWQDKRAHIARRSGGCFCWSFWSVPHIVRFFCNVPQHLKVLLLQGFLHIAGQRDGRWA